MEVKARKYLKNAAFALLVLIIIIPILFPLYFVFISSFKNMAQVYIMPPKLFGFKPIMDNYIYIFKTQHYGTYMINSAIVAISLYSAFTDPGSSGCLCNCTLPHDKSKHSDFNSTSSSKHINLAAILFYLF